MWAQFPVTVEIINVLIVFIGVDMVLWAYLVMRRGNNNASCVC